MSRYLLLLGIFILLACSSSPLLYFSHSPSLLCLRAGMLPWKPFFTPIEGLKESPCSPRPSAISRAVTLACGSLPSPLGPPPPATGIRRKHVFHSPCAIVLLLGGVIYPGTGLSNGISHSLLPRALFYTEWIYFNHYR